MSYLIFTLLAFWTLPGILLLTGVNGQKYWNHGKEVRIVKSKEICLSAHNMVRSFHKNTHSLRWDYRLANEAEKWARYLAKNVGKLKHSKNLNYQGENLYWRASQAVASCAQAVLSWYEEIDLYDYSNPVVDEKTGHFTQMVWRKTTSVGVGIAVKDIKDGYKETYIVARYRPPGNIPSPRALKDNVRPSLHPGKKPTLFQLDPSLCRDKAGYSTCARYTRFNFCKRYGWMMIDYCAKMCKMC